MSACVLLQTACKVGIFGQLCGLSGSEASQILGPLAAKRYLVRRTFSALEAAFEVLLAQLPQLSHGVR